MTRHISTSPLDFNNKDVVTQGERGVHIAADVRDARPTLTDRARYPSINSRASCRADSSAETAGRCDAAGAPSARTGVAAETSATAAASGFPCADYMVNTRRPRFPKWCGRLCCAG